MVEAVVIQISNGLVQGVAPRYCTVVQRGVAMVFYWWQSWTEVGAPPRHRDALHLALSLAGAKASVFRTISMKQVQSTKSATEANIESKNEVATLGAVVPPPQIDLMRRSDYQPEPQAYIRPGAFNFLNVSSFGNRC